MTPRIDLDLLRSFVAVVDSGSLTRAGTRLRLSQPAISLQMKRLEDSLGCRLLNRTPRSLALTGDGEMLLAYARRILELSDEVVARLSQSQAIGTVRLGTPEDFATTHLPIVLAAFARTHPNVALDITTDLTLNLLDRFHAGEFDLVLVKREPSGASLGVRVWRERLVWTAAASHAEWAHLAALPLIVSPHPCVYRKRAMEALDRAGRPWRVAYTSTSLAGAQAAVRAGLGVTVLPKDMVPADFTVLPDLAPTLPDTEIALMTAAAPSKAAELLGLHIVRSLEAEAA
eukprot:gene12881-12980_t